MIRVNKRERKEGDGKGLDEGQELLIGVHFWLLDDRAFPQDVSPLGALGTLSGNGDSG